MLPVIFLGSVSFFSTKGGGTWYFLLANRSRPSDTAQTQLSWAAFPQSSLPRGLSSFPILEKPS
jgi:hypothetical protein